MTAMNDAAPRRAGAAAFVVQTPGAQISFRGLERLHPFDHARSGGALAILEARHPDLDRILVNPQSPIDRSDLELVHEPAYLDSLADPRVLARVLKMPLVAWLMDRQQANTHLMTPFRWATAGTLAAGRLALETGAWVVALDGGFHHAHPDHGEGFCALADAAVMIAALRRDGLLRGKVLYIDLDAHPGDGFASCFLDDPRVRMLDFHAPASYIRPWPAQQRRLKRSIGRIDKVVRLRPFTGGRRYLGLLDSHLDRFLSRHAGDAELVVYNAGTDVLAGDPVGRLGLSPDAVRARDRMVLTRCHDLGVPLVALPAAAATPAAAGSFSPISAAKSSPFATPGESRHPGVALPPTAGMEPAHGPCRARPLTLRAALPKQLT